MANGSGLFKLVFFIIKAATRQNDLSGWWIIGIVVARFTSPTYPQPFQ